MCVEFKYIHKVIFVIALFLPADFIQCYHIKIKIFSFLIILFYVRIVEITSKTCYNSLTFITPLCYSK